ncbi:MAG TPA: glycosyltransferase [Vicinamibacterales bacterium]|nr:glycosyltransferase [Vicinamibacterales bacterium]
MRQSGIEVRSPPQWASGWMRRLFGSAQLALRMWRARRGIIHLFLPEAYIIGGLIGVGLRCPRMVMSRRSLNVYQRKYPFLRKLELWLHRRMTLVLGNSEAVLADLRAEGVPPSKLRLVRNAVDLDRFGNIPTRAESRERLGIAPDAYVMTMVANLIPYKGHADLLHALALAKDDLPPDWYLLCVGRDAGIESHLRRLAGELGLVERVRWLGEQKEVGTAFCAANVGILCSHEEGSPNSVIEGMALGLPMIVTDVGGTRELCVSGRNALIVPPRDPHRLASALVELAQDPALRRTLGDTAAMDVRSSFSIERCVNEYANIYIELSSYSRPARRRSRPMRFTRGV